MLENELIDKVKKFNLITDSKKVMNLIMDYLEENEHILNCAYDSIGRDEMKRFFYEDFITIVSPVIECAEQEHHIKYGIQGVCLQILYRSTCRNAY